MKTGNVLIGATKTPRESDINFRTGSVVYSKKTDQNGIVVTRDQYGRNKMINNAQTPVYFPKTKKIVAVYNRYLVSLDDRIGSVSSSQKGCLTKEFRKLYVPSKRSMSREQKVAIALNKCNIPNNRP
jgi:hypothetical protein